METRSGGKPVSQTINETTMFKYTCPRCKTETTTPITKQVGPHTGAYCPNCGRHLKWLGTAELMMMGKIPLPNPAHDPPLMSFSDAFGVEQMLSVISNMHVPVVVTNVKSQELLHKLEALCVEHRIHLALPKVAVETGVTNDTLAPWEEES